MLVFGIIPPESESTFPFQYYLKIHIYRLMITFHGAHHKCIKIHSFLWEKICLHTLNYSIVALLVNVLILYCQALITAERGIDGILNSSLYGKT